MNAPNTARPAIHTIQDLHERLAFIAQQAEKLGEELLEKSLPIDTLTIFASSRDEYATVQRLIRSFGPESLLSHGKTLYIEPSKLRIGNHTIKYLGVRQPDTTRPEAGYADYPVDNFAALLNKAKNSPFVTPVISGRGQALIELRHPDFAVRAYAVSAAEH